MNHHAIFTVQQLRVNYFQQSGLENLFKKKNSTKFGNKKLLFIKNRHSGRMGEVKKILVGEWQKGL
ncbi:hypothetical protein ACO0LM_13835 [Undibacterium sp. Di26W]|uniref:hypothetical protein n=1 Tax=Undibacterium sp. Di26W TaxID=3413035 RepID=UPI003BEFE161